MKCVEIRDWLKREKENILPAISRMLPSWLCVRVCVYVSRPTADKLKKGNSVAGSQYCCVYYYKLKCGECRFVAHELRVKIVNFDINYLCIGRVEKFEINLGYK